MRQPLKLGNITGFRLQASDGEIGEIEQIFFDDHLWTVRYFVIRTGSWLFGKEVLMSPSAVCSVDESNGTIEVDLSSEQIKNCPPVDTRQPISRHYEQEFHRYYGWEPYWTGDPFVSAEPVIPPAVTEEEIRRPENPQLRSSEEVKGYRIHASDGLIGHVADFILEMPHWGIRYLEVDTRQWLPGKHVLLAPAWIDSIDWLKSEVCVEIPKDTIADAPEYDPDSLISRAYEVELYAYYGKQFDESQ